MKHLGIYNQRSVSYLSVHDNLGWNRQLTHENWLAFTIVDKANQKTVQKAIDKILKAKPLYTCSAGPQARQTEDLLDEEIVAQAQQEGDRFQLVFNLHIAPITTSHANFSEGFWFALVAAHHESQAIEHVVCLDFTQRGVHNHLVELLEKFGLGWLPSDAEIELPKYDQ